MSSTHHPAYVHHFENLGEQKEAATFGMWVFIAQEILFFGGLFGAYAVYRNLHPEAFYYGSHHLNIPLGAFNTAVLICSSLTMALGVHAAALGKRTQIVGWLLATVFLGSVFLGIKVVEYKEKFDHHLVPGTSFDASQLHMESIEDPALLAKAHKAAQIYYSLYFSMTGLHALHMIIGIPIILWIAARAWLGQFGPEYHSPVEIVGLYWHFVDIVWIFLFPLLYLIPKPH